MLLIAVGGYALMSKSREEANNVKTASDEETHRVRTELLEAEDRTRRLLQDELSRWQVGFLQTLNGTYLRGNEAKLWFEALEKAVERVEAHLVSEHDLRKELLAALRQTPASPQA